MTANRALKLSLISLLALLLTGCWNRKELNEISIATAYGFDKNGDRYGVSVQIVNATEIGAGKGSGSRVPVLTVQTNNERSIFESIREMGTIAPRKIYSSHLRILVIGEDLARAGIAKVLDGLSRDHELRTDFYIIVARGATANQVLRILTPLEKLPTDKLYTSLETSQRNWGVSAKVDLHQLIYDLVDQGKDPVLTGIRIVGDIRTGGTRSNLNSVAAPAYMQYQGLGVFHKDKLVGWLNDKQSMGYNFIRGNISSTIVQLPCSGGDDLDVELIRMNHRIKGRIVDGEPRIEVTVKAEGNIGEVECGMNIATNEAIELLEKELSDQIENMMKAAVARGKYYKSDIFGFGSAIHRADYRAWNRMKNRWEQEFADLPVHIAVNAKIRRTGSIVESFLERMEAESD
ncbi:spore germination protein KC [Paenibacillus sp. UNC496MF]|uniref:Ger(x)C family spore germination protein n=1 Tax=Paenibacillus sp. UNC496MF TaxID=1502753 RepID=UPI0008F20416|nr:Ger(x)C family spore germination protein [Paenibacillus sp. UNC496MF]SFJ21595.1 spore germination protein KC [Paenibacillus sp. UNC496MF]